MKLSFAFALLASSFAASATTAQEMAPRIQQNAFSVDLGLGVSVKPTYPGADDTKAGPWLIWRNASFGGEKGDGQGVSFSPSFNLIGERDGGTDQNLLRLGNIDRTVELGGKVSYGVGQLTAYGAVRKGFGGHEGFAGEFGAMYRTDLSDRVTLWSGLEFGYGDAEFNDTYFGVSENETNFTDFAAFDAGGGVNSAAVTFQAEYAINDATSVLGEVSYGKLIGDVADSPLVQDEYQPSMRLGIVRKLSFGF